MASVDDHNPGNWQMRRISYALPLLVATFACAFYSQFWLSHDDSWYLVATRKFLDGAQLYVDIMEVNPPLNFYLTVPGLLLADTIGLSDTVGYVIAICILAGLCGMWLMRLMRQSDLQFREQIAILIAALIGLFLLPIGEFAQREHLLFVFALPYLTYLILGDERVKVGLAEKLFLGLVATLGIALKPYFLLIPAGIVLVGPIARLPARAFAPANLALAAGLFAYALFTIVVHPEFFSDILAVAQKVYWAYGFEASRIIFRGEVTAVLIFAYLFLGGFVEKNTVGWRVFAAIIASLASYLIQFKGWTYHLLPLLFFLMFGAIWLAARGRLFAQEKLVPKVIVVALLMISLGSQVITGPYRPRTTDAFSPFIERPGETIAGYSTSVWIAFPFVNAVDGEWASRYPAQWMIPGAVLNLDSERCPEDGAFCAQFEKILANIRKANTEDFLRYEPDVVFIDMREDKPYFRDVQFDYLQFQLQDPEFAAAWENYQLVGRTPGFFDVWRRKADGQ